MTSSKLWAHFSEVSGGGPGGRRLLDRGGRLGHRHPRFGDRALIGVLSVTRSIPEYAIASGLLILFAVTYPVFPQAGAHEAFATYSSTWDHVSDILFHLALPLAALTLGLLANKFLIVRNTAIATPQRANSVPRSPRAGPAPGHPPSSPRSRNAGSCRLGG